MQHAVHRPWPLSGLRLLPGLGSIKSEGPEGGVRPCVCSSDADGLFFPAPKLTHSLMETTPFLLLSGMSKLIRPFESGFLLADG